MKKFYFGIFIVLLFTACSTSGNCEDTACFSPPPDFEFKIVDATTGENLYTNGALIQNNIKLIDEDGKPVQIRFNSENDRNTLHLGMGWEEGNKEYILTLSPEIAISINMEVDQKSENCCSFYKISNLTISPYEFEVDNTSGIYTISIPQN